MREAKTIAVLLLLYWLMNPFGGNVITSLVLPPLFVATCIYLGMLLVDRFFVQPRRRREEGDEPDPLAAYDDDEDDIVDVRYNQEYDNDYDDYDDYDGDDGGAPPR